MTRAERKVTFFHDSPDMHYHCEECGETSSVPSLCHADGCPGRGEDMVICRKKQCAPDV